MNVDIYERLAPYYDLLHKRLNEDIGFILTLAAQVEGSLLEIGCGTGRLLLPLARAGFSVTGVDNSPAMLERARLRLRGEAEATRERVNLLQGDASHLDFDQTAFSLVLIAYNTFLHFDPRQAVSVCRAAAGSLLPGGRLFLDLANPYLVEQTPEDRFLTLERLLELPESNELLLVQASSRLATSAQKLIITWIYDRSPAGGGPVDRTIVVVDYYYYYPHQIELILEESGLRLEAMYGNYDQSPFTEDSERLLVLARKV